MALLQISEPGQTPEPHQRRIGIGIDLGTTHSLVAVVRNGVAETLPNANEQHLLPSIVYYGSNDKQVGTSAETLGKTDPFNLVSSIKRWMGRPFQALPESEINTHRWEEGENGIPYLKLPNARVNPIQVSAEILTSLADRAEATLLQPVDGAVITVPAYFDDMQRQATKEAAQLAGLTVLRLLNEPTAAALAYGLDSKQEGVIVVYDLGGGTFDVSILNLQRGLFEVLATAGDAALGGDDFDALLVHELKQRLAITHDDRVSDHALLQTAKKIKIALSQSTSVTQTIHHQEITITRSEFEALIAPWIQKTLQICRRAMKDAAIEPEEVAEIVMVGGSTRIPFVRSEVADYFQKTPLTSIDPDKVVAIGAAIQANILVGNRSDDDVLLLDVIPLSLGIETMGGLVEKIIPRNSTIPCARAQEFTTFKDGQTAMMIHVVQGERDLVADCRSLAQFTLHHIPALPAGAAHIRVTFQVDADGLLSVTALEKSTQSMARIEVKPAYGLSENEIATMLTEAMANAEKDKQIRSLNEQRVEAARVIEATQTALSKDGDLLQEAEYRAIQTAIETLRQLIQGDSAEALIEQIKVLDHVTQTFAALRMDRSIRTSLTGKHIHQIEDI